MTEDWNADDLRKDKNLQSLGIVSKKRQKFIKLKHLHVKMHNLVHYELSEFVTESPEALRSDQLAEKGG